MGFRAPTERWEVAVRTLSNAWRWLPPGGLTHLKKKPGLKTEEDGVGLLWVPPISLPLTVFGLGVTAYSPPKGPSPVDQPSDFVFLKQQSDSCACPPPPSLQSHTHLVTWVPAPSSLFNLPFPHTPFFSSLGKAPAALAEARESICAASASVLAYWVVQIFKYLWYRKHGEH